MYNRSSRLQLSPGGLYRISYAVGGAPQRRLTRSVVRFEGQVDKRQWDGGVVGCLEFTRPHGRTLTLLTSQLVDIRAATLNERGQLVLCDEPAAQRRRLVRRRTHAAV